MRKIFGIQIWLFLLNLLLHLFQYAKGAVMPPPWANPKLNPCASHPLGWQLLFWPPDGKCYKIFQVGHPCPNGMELTPSLSKSGKNLSAECKCVPQTAQSATNGECYPLFSAGPCNEGFYFGPDTKYKSENSKRQWGTCKQMKACSKGNEIYWPKDGKCYKTFSRGPCAKGQLIIEDSKSKIPVCSCDETQLQEYRYYDNRCYQHYTKGPCQEKGHLFLPGKTCNCFSNLPNYHQDSQQCFELGTVGPCSSGQKYDLQLPTDSHASCHCKPKYIPYQNSTSCYRLYTKGPCAKGQILLDSNTCIRQPCERGSLYFPDENKCYRIGIRGPCPTNRVVAFDFDTRPSIDGISYNGVCVCAKKDCEPMIELCDRTKGLIRYKGQCHKMYTQGPCSRGSWLVPKRNGRDEVLEAGSKERLGVCECIPGYARKVRTIGNETVSVCMSPAVVLAEYLNANRTEITVIRV
ncbi:unnamed protein product [Diabrotica balteata]|uniref:DUF4789 domain-containing protein n=1 Tax=Diabrotica balteata TaxID=107213 RepID=A0A9P0GXB4_DIABA|nr:unnamed protein product [Diabrotica balteata]